MPPHAASHAFRPFLQTPAFGTLCGLFSAVGYTACNACLRAVSQEVDPFFVSAMRAVPTVLMLGPLVMARPLYGLPMLPPRRVILLLVVTGLLAHVGGNSLFQYSLGVVGMALAVPLCLGSMIVGGALIGRIVLGEPVTPRMAFGLVLLTAAIFVLSAGAQAAQTAMHREQQTLAAALGDSSPHGEIATASGDVSAQAKLLFGVGAACLAGLLYTILGATIRHATQGLSNVSQTLTIVSTSGLVVLIGISCFTVPPDEFDRINSHQVIMMGLAGLLNAVAFIALTRALQLTSLVYVQALNATQATMAALAGIALFGEAISEYLMVGLGLTIVGLGLMQGGRRFPHRSSRETE